MDKETKKKRWKSIKEGWYEKINVSLKTLDWIIGIAIAVLAVTVVLIVLEATGTFYLFK